MAVIEKPQVRPAVRPDSIDDELVPEAPGTAVNFYSGKYRDLRLIRQPQTETQGATGQKVRTLDPVRYEFGPTGTLTVYVGNDVLEDGEYIPESGGAKPIDAVGWLRRHHLFNADFYEENREPGRPLPIETDFLKDVNAALSEKDADKLLALLVQERETHGRPVLLSSVEHALGLLEVEVPEGEVVQRQTPVAPLPPKPEDLAAQRAAALADEAKSGEGGVPLDKVAPYSGPSGNQIF